MRIRSVMRLPVWANLLPNISFLMRSVGSIETIKTRTPGTLWDPIRLQGVSGLIGKRLPPIITRLKPPLLTCLHHHYQHHYHLSYLVDQCLLPPNPRPSTLSRLTLNISWTSPTWSEVTTWRRCSGPTICTCGREFVIDGLRF